MPSSLTSTHTPITYEDAGAGRPALVLHGGGGPATVASVSRHLAGTHRTITPTLPGWNGQPRPDRLTRIDQLADALLGLLAELGLADVLVVGSSIGGWIACEMAARDSGGRVGRLVLVDAMGIDVPGEPITDFFALDARGIAEHSFHDADAYYVDPAALAPAQAAAMQANLASLRVFAGDPYMHDPALADRLGDVRLDALVIWGDSDAIATPAYGRAYAAHLPRGRFALVADAGHLPQIEQPDATFALIDAFASPAAAHHQVPIATAARDASGDRDRHDETRLGTPVR